MKKRAQMLSCSFSISFMEINLMMDLKSIIICSCTFCAGGIQLGTALHDFFMVNDPKQPIGGTEQGVVVRRNAVKDGIGKVNTAVEKQLPARRYRASLEVRRYRDA